jgi:hypothetical protein
MMGDQQPRNREDLTSCVSQKAATELIEFGQGDEPGPSLPRENGKRFGDSQTGDDMLRPGRLQ